MQSQSSKLLASVLVTSKLIRKKPSSGSQNRVSRLGWSSVVERLPRVCKASALLSSCTDRRKKMQASLYVSDPFYWGFR